MWLGLKLNYVEEDDKILVMFSVRNCQFCQYYFT